MILILSGRIPNINSLFSKLAFNWFNFCSKISLSLDKSLGFTFSFLVFFFLPKLITDLAFSSANADKIFLIYSDDSTVKLAKYIKKI